jgi:transcriptional regulator
MYLPSHFEESRVDVLHGLVREHPLGTLVVSGPAGLDANHVPFLFDPEPRPYGTLRAHVARANDVWRKAGSEVLVIFQGPSAYVSPGWYPSKKETGKVVPTFNYLAVHAWGRMSAVEDAAWLRAFVERLTQRFEAGRANPWAVSDAPSDFIDAQLRAIVGLEIPVSRLLGKWKLSQNRPAADREGVERALSAHDSPIAHWMKHD